MFIAHTIDAFDGAAGVKRPGLQIRLVSADNWTLENETENSIICANLTAKSKTNK